MQKVLIATFAILIGGAIGQSFLAWWSLPVLAALIAVMLQLRQPAALISGCLGGFILWGGYAAFLDSQNNGILSARIGELFGGMESMLLVLTTGIFGAIFAALGAWTGSLAKAFK
ncbi:MAG: hypothetical protein HRU12_12690 [Phaeodactylibacter sp.]|nr:hypothetical protein [Phaeodactylibacter sp.]